MGQPAQAQFDATLPSPPDPLDHRAQPGGVEALDSRQVEDQARTDLRHLGFDLTDQARGAVPVQAGTDFDNRSFLQSPSLVLFETRLLGPIDGPIG